MLLAGLGLTGLAAAGAWAAVTLLRVTWLLAPVAVIPAFGAALAAWAAAIHFTGGEKFDDHPWV